MDYTVYTCTLYVCRYMYWNVRGDVDNNGLFRGPLGDFRSSQSASCPIETPMEETIFQSPDLRDFVLEPDVFIYFIDNESLHYVGFDKQNNGSIPLNATFVESFGEVTVTITNNVALKCNTSTDDCSSQVAVYLSAVYPVIDDILVFRKSKQPLPGMFKYCYFL